MIDAQTAVHQAFFDALNNAIAVTTVADVWQNPPQEQQPVPKPLVVLGLVSLQGPEDKDGGMDSATIEIFTEVRQPDARALYALNKVVRNALEGQPITAAGADLSPPVFLAAEPVRLADGLTYQDKLTFSTFVQAP
jgi:hypothetical protein